MPGPIPDAPLPHPFGEVAVAMGLVDEEQVRQALRRQQEMRQRRSASRIGEVMIFMNLLTKEQVREVVAEQRRRRQAEADEKLPRERFGDFRLLKRIGRGGMGEVFQAKNVFTDDIVALKVLARLKWREQDNVARFQRELELSKQLDHPHIVKTFNAGIHQNIQYLATEYVEGESLAAAIRGRGAVAEPEALRIARAVAQALNYAHDHGLVHRDVKPENILLGDAAAGGEGAVKLCDLGTAKNYLEETGLTQTGVIVGTPHYLAPEQAKGEKQIDGRADIYALGATLYHAVTGKLPFAGASATDVMMKHLTAPAPNPQDVRPDLNLSDGLVRIIAKAMAKEPKHRYPSAAMLAEDIEALQAGESLKHAGVDFNKSIILPPKPKNVAPKGKGCLGVLMVGLAAGAVFARAVWSIIG